MTVMRFSAVPESSGASVECANLSCDSLGGPERGDPLRELLREPLGELLGERREWRLN